ncbi:UNVERIFIED_CONTAM: hypothetical protein GTU68_038451 [Idotea baltica]|nr:hypothetical protein [Idotea baltica]
MRTPLHGIRAQSARLRVNITIIKAMACTNAFVAQRHYSTLTLNMTQAAVGPVFFNR